MEYMDLYLIHAPTGGKNIETFEAMQDLVKQELVRFVYNSLLIFFFKKYMYVYALYYFNTYPL